MSKIVVSEKALRELMRIALDGGHLGDMAVADEQTPVNVSGVVDPSAAQTDPINPDFVPQTKPELDVAIKQLTKDVPIDQVPSFYKTLRAVIDVQNKQSEEDESMKKAAQGGTTQVEEAIRKEVRKMLTTMLEAKPGFDWKNAPSPTNPNNVVPRRVDFGTHGGEYNRGIERTKKSLTKDLGRAVSTLDAPVNYGDDDETPDGEERPDGDGPPGSADDNAPAKKSPYKTSAVGGTADVGGMSLQDMAAALGKSVAGAKRDQDFAMRKAQWVNQNLYKTDIDQKASLNVNQQDIDALQKFGLNLDDLEGDDALDALHDSASVAYVDTLRQKPDQGVLDKAARLSYIDYLKKSGELTPGDVQLMADHPDVVDGLEGFQEFKGQFSQDPFAYLKMHPWVVQELDEYREFLDKVIKKMPAGWPQKGTPNAGEFIDPTKAKKNVATAAESKVIRKGNLKIVLEKKARKRR